MGNYSRSLQKGNRGEAFVEALISEHAIVHRVDGSKDTGLDLLCEWVVDEKTTGAFFGVQVKTRTSVRLTENNSNTNVLPSLKGHINIGKTKEKSQKIMKYWTSLGFPVFLFLVKVGEKKTRVYYKRYTSILHGLQKEKNEPFYEVMNQNEFQAYRIKNGKTWGFSRDLYIDYIRCQHNKGMLTGIDPKELGVEGWEKDVLYEGVFEKYKQQINTTFEIYKKFSKYFK